MNNKYVYFKTNDGRIEFLLIKEYGIICAYGDSADIYDFFKSAENSINKDLHLLIFVKEGDFGAENLEKFVRDDPSGFYTFVDRLIEDIKYDNTVFNKKVYIDFLKKISSLDLVLYSFKSIDHFLSSYVMPNVKKKVPMYYTQGVDVFSISRLYENQYFTRYKIFFGAYIGDVIRVTDKNYCCLYMNDEADKYLTEEGHLFEVINGIYNNVDFKVLYFIIGNTRGNVKFKKFCDDFGATRVRDASEIEEVIGSTYDFLYELPENLQRKYANPTVYKIYGEHIDLTVQ